LDAPGPSSSPRVTLYGSTQIVPFSSAAQALEYMRSRLQAGHVALALFDRASPHWPNPVNWTKSDDPSYTSVIAQQIAKHAAPAQAAGEYGGEMVGSIPWYTLVGGVPWYTIVGQTVGVLRRQATAAAEEMTGRAIGTLRLADGSWQLKSFRTLDDADDWFGRVTAEPRDFTYAAYFDKTKHGVPYLENEKIGGARARSLPGPSITREIATVTVRP
jgi:hypothetical protein